MLTYGGHGPCDKGNETGHWHTADTAPGTGERLRGEGVACGPCLWSWQRAGISRLLSPALLTVLIAPLVVQAMLDGAAQGADGAQAGEAAAAEPMVAAA